MSKEEKDNCDLARNMILEREHIAHRAFENSQFYIVVHIFIGEDKR